MYIIFDLWYEIDLARIRPANIITIFKISKTCKIKYELDKIPGYLLLTGFFAHLLNIRKLRLYLQT